MQRWPGTRKIARNETPNNEAACGNFKSLHLQASRRKYTEYMAGQGRRHIGRLQIRHWAVISFPKYGSRSCARILRRRNWQGWSQSEIPPECFTHLFVIMLQQQAVSKGMLTLLLVLLLRDGGTLRLQRHIFTLCTASWGLRKRHYYVPACEIIVGGVPPGCTCNLLPVGFEICCLRRSACYNVTKCVAQWK